MVVLQEVIEIITKSRQVSFTETLHGIPYLQESQISVAAKKIHDMPGIFHNIRRSSYKPQNSPFDLKF